MGTRSVIAAKVNDELIVGTYCHYDGYLAGVGLTLFENYNDANGAFFLANFGYMSSLKESPAEMMEYAHANKDEPMRVSPSEDIRELANHCGAEFVYLFEDGNWYYWDIYKESGKKLLKAESFLPELKHSVEYSKKMVVSNPTNKEYAEYLKYYEAKYNEMAKKAVGELVSLAA